MFVDGICRRSALHPAKGTAAHPWNPLAGVFTPCTPPHPLAPSPINGEGEQQAVPLSGVRSMCRALLMLHCWHYVGAAPSPARCPELRRRVERERGGRVSGRGEVCWAKQHYNNAEYGSAGSGEPIFWMPILEGA